MDSFLEGTRNGLQWDFLQSVEGTHNGFLCKRNRHWNESSAGRTSNDSFAKGTHNGFVCGRDTHWSESFVEEAHNDSFVKTTHNGFCYGKDTHWNPSSVEGAHNGNESSAEGTRNKIFCKRDTHVFFCRREAQWNPL